STNVWVIGVKVSCSGLDGFRSRCVNQGGEPFPILPSVLLFEAPNGGVVFLPASDGALTEVHECARFLLGLTRRACAGDDVVLRRNWTQHGRFVIHEFVGYARLSERAPSSHLSDCRVI